MRNPSTDIDELADIFFDGVLERDPISATMIGDDRWDDRLPDFGEAERAADMAACHDLLLKAEALDPQGVGREQAVTRDMLILFARNRLEALEAQQYQLAIDHIDGIQNLPMTIAEYQVAKTPGQLDAMLARFAAYPTAIDQHIATLREGIAHGRTSAASPVRKTIEQTEAMLVTPAADSPVGRIAQVVDDAARERVRQAVQTHIQPALQTLHDFLVDEYEPKARPEPGLGTTPDGEAAYELAIRLQTTLPATPDEIHRFGLEEVESIEIEMDMLARRLGHRDRHTLRRALVANPATSWATGPKLLDLATDQTRRAMARARDVFARVPRADCVVKPMEASRERFYAGAYYMWPAADGSRPGQYYIPAATPQPLFLLAALTFHEAIPGHHFQAAIELELENLPRFRRQVFSVCSLGGDRRGGPPAMGVGFVEGWGLYAERLADELGLYASEEERFGMLEMQLDRALRLVVDSGLHARGWSRDQAISYLHDRLDRLPPRSWAEGGVDRYTVWPGQALAYAMGQREIERARRQISETMGDRFDVRTFHSEVLGHGSLPLSIFRREISGWVEAATARTGDGAAPNSVLRATDER
jgi:uncharacterized protein (DUF885 family)